MSKNKQSNIHNLKATQSINHYLKFYYKADLPSFSPNHSSTALSRLNSSKLGPCMVMAKRALSTLLLKLFLWVVFTLLRVEKLLSQSAVDVGRSIPTAASLCKLGWDKYLIHFWTTVSRNNCSCIQYKLSRTYKIYTAAH